MKTNPRPCVVLSDYPIKTMTYQRFLSGLGENAVFAFKSLADRDLGKVSKARLVVCDMNVMEEFEAETLARVECLFPRANILFLEEDHSDMKLRFSDQRDICRLGKMAEIHVVFSTIKELLLQAGTDPAKIPGNPVGQAAQT